MRKRKCCSNVFTISLSLLFVFASNLAGAQRNIDFATEITSPSSGTTVYVNQSVMVNYKITNYGADTFKTTDSFRLYVIIDNDSIIFNTQPFEQYLTYSGYAAIPGSFFSSAFPASFDESFSGSTIEFCFSVVPINNSDLIIDTNMANNKNCITLDISDGTASVSYTNFSKTGTTFFPNPVTSILNLRHPSGELRTIEVYDAQGRLVKSESVTGKENAIDVSEVPTGLYFLKIMSPGKKDEVIKGSKI